MFLEYTLLKTLKKKKSPSGDMSSSGLTPPKPFYTGSCASPTSFATSAPSSISSRSSSRRIYRLHLVLLVLLVLLVRRPVVVLLVPLLVHLVLLYQNVPATA